MATACKKALIYCYLLVLIGCNADNLDTQDLEQSFLFAKSNGDYLVDESRSLSITEVLAKESGFSPSLEIPNKFMVNAAIWQRFEVENLFPEEKSLILIYKYNIIHQLSAYSFPLNQNIPKYSGTTVDPQQRDLKNWKMGFTFTFKPHEKKTILIKSTTSDRVNLSHEWLTPKAYQTQLMQNLAAQNLFYGVMLVLILYNFFLFLSSVWSETKFLPLQLSFFYRG
ncbi:MAG: 7TM-DISM domain-containing protein [Oligoflexales bacterium]